MTINLSAESIELIIKSISCFEKELKKRKSNNTETIYDLEYLKETFKDLARSETMR